MPTGDPIIKDVTEVGEYVAVITATDGHYKGAKAYVRFDIDPIEFRAVRVKGGDSTVTYNGEKHDFEFEFDISGDGTDWVTLDRGEDYTVKYVYQTTDTTDESTTDVVDAGSYRAVIEGIGAYDGTVELSQRIKVEKLDLSEVTVEGVISDSASNPYDPSAIWIDGQRFAADSNIMKEIRAVITAGPLQDLVRQRRVHLHAPGRDRGRPEHRREQDPGLQVLQGRQAHRRGPGVLRRRRLGRRVQHLPR